VSLVSVLVIFLIIVGFVLNLIQVKDLFPVRIVLIFPVLADVIVSGNLMLPVERK